MSIWLRSIKKNDSKYIVEWRNNNKVRNHLLHNEPITEESNLMFYNDNVLTQKYYQYIVEQTDENFPQISYPIATVYIKNIDCINERCEIGFFPCQRIEWQGKTQQEAITLLIEKICKEHKIHKVYTYVFADCLDELSLFLQIGFKQEGYYKDEIKTNNSKYRDLVRLSFVKINYS